MSTNVSTFSKWCEREAEFESIQTHSLNCPHCRTPIKMVVPRDTNLYDFLDEAEHWKSYAESLQREVIQLRLCLQRNTPYIIPDAPAKTPHTT